MSEQEKWEEIELEQKINNLIESTSWGWESRKEDKNKLKQFISTLLTQKDEEIAKRDERIRELEKEIKEYCKYQGISKCAYCDFTCQTLELKEHPEIMAKHISEHCKDHPVYKCFKQQEEMEKEISELKKRNCELEGSLNNKNVLLEASEED